MSDAVRRFELAAWERAPVHYAAGFGRATAAFVPALLEAGGVGAGMRVLDLCCGLGVVPAAAQARGALVDGVDFSPAMLAAARRVVPGVVFRQGDAAALPLAGGCRDAVLANFGVHHVPEPVAVLREAWRVLVPGGRVAFTVWAGLARNQAWRLLFDAIGRHGNADTGGAPPPQGGLSEPGQCAALLTQAGFAEVAAEAVEARWEVADADALVDAFRTGTARMAAVIGAQSAAQIGRIVEDMQANAAEFRNGAGLSVPIAAVMARGVR